MPPSPAKAAALAYQAASVDGTRTEPFTSGRLSAPSLTRQPLSSAACSCSPVVLVLGDTLRSDSSAAGPPSTLSTPGRCSSCGDTWQESVRCPACAQPVHGWRPSIHPDARLSHCGTQEEGYQLLVSTRQGPSGEGPPVWAIGRSQRPPTCASASNGRTPGSADRPASSPATHPVHHDLDRGGCPPSIPAQCKEAFPDLSMNVEPRLKAASAPIASKMLPDSRTGDPPFKPREMVR
jgi:hypothetical protein